MERVAVAEVEASRADGAEQRDLAAEVGATGVAMNHYRIPAGETFPAGVHAHADQEEVFLVLDGVATFETRTGDVVVEAGEAIRFAPGEFQLGSNGGDDPLVALALGAPAETTDIRIPVACPDCGHGDLRLDTGPAALQFVCPICSSRHDPAPCPDCGGSTLTARLDDRGESFVRCGDCGLELDSAPLADD